MRANAERKICPVCDGDYLPNYARQICCSVPCSLRRKRPFVPRKGILAKLHRERQAREWGQTEGVATAARMISEQKPGDKEGGSE